VGRRPTGSAYSPTFKFQVVLEAEGKGIEAQVARAYGVHPVTLAKWKREFLERGAEVFGEKEVNAYEKKIVELERRSCQDFCVTFCGAGYRWANICSSCS